MKKPHCALCGVNPSEHSDLYCNILKLVRKKYERELKHERTYLEKKEGTIDRLVTEYGVLTRKLAEATTELEGIYELLTGETPSQVLHTFAIQRIRELRSKITLRDVQIVDLTIERNSYKSMYQSSQDINAGLTKEHNELKTAYEKLACSQPTPAEHLTNQMSKLISSMNEAGAAAVRPAPGRLEIAAMVLAGLAADPDLSATREDCIKEAILMATKLIKADQA